MDFLDSYFKYEINSEISGLTEQLNSFYLQKLVEKYNRNILVLTSTLYEANKIYNLVSKDYENTLLFPMDDFIVSEALASSPDLMSKRIETLNELSISEDKKIIVTKSCNYF